MIKSYIVIVLLLDSRLNRDCAVHNFHLLLVVGHWTELTVNVKRRCCKLEAISRQLAGELRRQWYKGTGSTGREIQVRPREYKSTLS